jgi:pimeloyl-ACP methyl ester carboxylesterase
LIIEIKKKKIFANDVGYTFDKKKPTIILLHGSGQSHVVWSLTDQFLADKDFNVFTLDLPGHGNSDGPCLKSIEEMSEWLNVFVEHFGIEKTIIAGHSQGCLIALDFVKKHSKKVKKIIFIAGSYSIPVNKSLIELALSGNLEALNLMMKWGYGSSKQFIGGNPLQKILNSSREVREVLATDLIACNNYKNGVDAVKSITCPTLFIFGEIDKMIKLESGKKFADMVNNSQIHVIKDCGHMIILENAFEMREKMVEFLKS